MNWSALTAVLAQLDARWAACGSVTTFALIAGLALRWRIFLRQQKIELPYRTILSLTWVGQFFNSVLPGSTGGDVVKLFQICRLAPTRKAAAAATVFVDRLSALFALLTLALTAVLIDPIPFRSLPRPAGSINALLLGGTLLAILCVGAGWLIAQFFRGTTAGGRFVRTLAAAKSALQFNSRLLGAVALAFGIHMLNFLTIYFFARALGIPITYAQVALMMPVILFLVMVPLTINGHGLREILLIAYFSYFGVVAVGGANVEVRETAIALSLVAVANDLLWSVPGGLLYIARFRARVDLPQ